MGYICHECIDKIFNAGQKARNEINRRLDDGETAVDLFVEYQNELIELVLNKKSDDERYWFLNEASSICMRELGIGTVFKAGWTHNRSGKFVRINP